jgi:nitrogen fixation protein NifQ
MDAALAYQELIQAADRSACDAFDAHVAAAILALGRSEAVGTADSVCERVGLDGAALRRLVAALFPEAMGICAGVDLCLRLKVGDEEQTLRDLLWMYSTDASPLQRDLAAMIARRCLRPHHLWQDLGLRNRAELSQLMRRHFATLAQRNRNDMKWKKYLYRAICRADGFSLCAAPVCSDCDDFAVCFGGEDGESLLARNRLAQGRPG